MTTETPAKKTHYTVLRSLGDVVGAEAAIPDVWAIVAEEVEAHSSDAAIRHVCEAMATEGTFRATPSRRFKDVVVTIETEPRIVLKGRQGTLPV